MYIDKEELLEVLEEKYGDLKNDRGCFYNNDEWLSIARIVAIIEKMDTYD